MGTKEDYQELEDFEKRNNINENLSEEQKEQLQLKFERNYRAWKQKCIEKQQLRREYEKEVQYEKQHLNGFEDYLKKRGFEEYDEL